MFCKYKVEGSSPPISIKTPVKKQIKKNINQRNSFKLNEENRLILKSLTYNNFIKKKTRWKMQMFFLNLPIKSSLTRIKNICLLTGRSRGFLRNFKLSRIQFKLFVSKGLLFNVKKK